MILVIIASIPHIYFPVTVQFLISAAHLTHAGFQILSWDLATTTHRIQILRFLSTRTIQNLMIVHATKVSIFSVSKVSKSLT
jgi:hypothetical protein